MTTHLWDALVQGLRDHGYVEGENLRVERRFGPEGQPEHLRALAAELVRLKVDLIVATGTLTPHAAKAATATIPVVVTNHGDPVGSGLVVSLARPGGNVTGLSLLGRELVAKQLELLKTVAPRVARVGVLFNPNSQSHPGILTDSEAPARALGLKLQRVPLGSLDGYERAFAAVTGARADGILVLGDPISWQHRSRIAELATRHRLPGMFAQREYVEAGGLLSYGASLVDSFRRAAAFVDKILKGAKPAELPIEQPSKFELVVNAKVARALGVAIPQSVRVQADHIID